MKILLDEDTARELKAARKQIGKAERDLSTAAQIDGLIRWVDVIMGALGLDGKCQTCGHELVPYANEEEDDENPDTFCPSCI